MCYSFYIILSGTVSVYIDPRMTGEEEYGAALKPSSARKVSAKSENNEDKKKKQEGEGGGEKKEVTIEGDDKENTTEEGEQRTTEQQKQPKRIKELDRSKFGKMIVQYGTDNYKIFCFVYFDSNTEPLLVDIE